MQSHANNDTQQAQNCSVHELESAPGPQWQTDENGQQLIHGSAALAAMVFDGLRRSRDIAVGDVGRLGRCRAAAMQGIGTHSTMKIAESSPLSHLAGETVIRDW